MVMRPRGDYGGYADCYQQNGGGGGHHFYESIKNELESFRLRGGANDDFSAADLLLNDDTSSIASKKRIDSMFRTTGSVAGDGKRTPGGRSATVGGRRTKSLLAAGDCNYSAVDYGYAAAAVAVASTGTGVEAAGGNKNTVQEKIEKMFAEISSSELDTDVSMDSAAATTAGNKFHVQYIGCAGLSGKISSLEGLQQPVRDMYFCYRENHHLRHHSGDGGRDFSGLLEISAAGLSIRYRDDQGDTVHRTNPFPSIAVWAALKYVCRRQSPRPQRRPFAGGRPSPPPSGGYEYAFLPLIADPDGSDKAPLFRDMDAGDRARLDAAGDHAPVFAVVTRKPGKRLECHGFACETENDALLMAANLYGALVTAMSSVAVDGAAGHVDGDGDSPDEQQQTVVASTRRVIRQRNGFTSMSSTAGSSLCGGGDGGGDAPTPPPPRPPRRNKKSVSSATSSVVGVPEESAAATVHHDDMCSDAKTFRMTVRQSPSLRRGVCNSSAATVMDATKRKDGGGDILTKVAIPRSRSFLNSNGLASGKYSRRAAGSGVEAVALDRRRRRSNGSSVMGFSDMFNELRVQEGLNSMDDILDAIINVEGMSYNDLKPIYREFLMKLSVTLTKDELYQRTKAIMTEQKRKRNKRRPAVVSVMAGRGRRWNDKLRVALNLRAAKSRLGAVLVPDFCIRDRTSGKPRRSCSCSAAVVRRGSSSTTATDRKPERKSKRRAVAGKRTVASAVKGRRLVASSPVCSTSDDSDFFAAAAFRQRQQLQKLQQQQQQQQQHKLSRKSRTRSSKGKSSTTTTASEAGGCAHPASSGYFSCSECSAGAVEDKCYCGVIDGDTEHASLVSCSCDSDSCADSDKCYCGKPRRPRNIFDELKSRGFAASESSVSRADSPGTAWKKNELLMSRQRHDSGPGGSGSCASAATVGRGTRTCGVESSKSIEYLQVSRRPTADHHYTAVAKQPTDRMKVYGQSPSHSTGTTTTTAAGSSSSPASSLSAATVYSSSSTVGGAAGHRGGKQRRSGSSGSDNFRAIDYALFATHHTSGAAAGRKPRATGKQPHVTSRYGAAAAGVAGHRLLPSAAPMAKRSHSSEAVHLSGCRVFHHHQQQHGLQQHRHQARRHSVHHAGSDHVLSSFFKSDIENSLGYYP